MCPFLLCQKIFGSLPFFFALSCNGPVVLEVDQITGMAGHGGDVPGDDFVQIFKFFVANHQGAAQGESVELFLLQDVNVLVDALGRDFPGHCQMILTSG